VAVSALSETMTLRNMRENGVRSLAITCGAVWCKWSIFCSQDLRRLSSNGSAFNEPVKNRQMVTPKIIDFIATAPRPIKQ